jgi:2-oxoglutarate ferredoxin oxidoreductase subunit alpha
MVRADLDAEAEVLLISYGITARAMGEAVRQARAQGHRVSALTLLSLWPLPEKPIQVALRNARRVVVAELNDGQMRREIERLACSTPGSAQSLGVQVLGVHRLDGELITPEQIGKQGGIL